jgi:hypothetical protein
MREIAARDGHRLFAREDAHNPPWYNFKLVKDEWRRHREKRAWWFGSCGDRVAEVRDTQLLRTHRPDLYEWVREESARYVNARSLLD